MELAALLAAGLRDWVDFGVIVGILILNAAVGWYQEGAAEKIVESLKGDIAMRARVVRDGSEQDILARELVPGDIIIVEEGRSVPADSILICDYSTPGDYEMYKEIKRTNDLGVSTDPDDDQHDDEGEGGKPKHGHTIYTILLVANAARLMPLSLYLPSNLSSVVLLLSSRVLKIRVISSRSWTTSVPLSSSSSSSSSWLLGSVVSSVT
jgi:H+-transporting ATPase